MSTPKGPEDIRQLAAEVGRRFGLYHEQVDRLQTERTQENERLRADLGRLEAEIARVNQDNDRLRAERDELLAAFSRMAELADQVRQSRGGGVTG